MQSQDFEARESQMNLSSIMSSPVRSLPADTSALDALALADRCGMHHFPVTDGDELLGLVCTCDLEDVELTSPLRSAIRRAPVTLAPDARPSEAADTMRRELVGSVLVLDGGRAVGIVTREDLCELGLDLADAPNFHCDSCGAITHLRRRGKQGLLCLDCRSRANPDSPFDETGTVD